MMGQTTPKGFPQTPPTSTRKSHAYKPIPKFQLPEEPPSGNSMHSHGQLQTPATTRTRRRSVNSSPAHVFDSTKGMTLFPPSPDCTPQRSPRSKRKKISFESFFPATDSFSVLLPNHSTVGSGRKHLEASASMSKAQLSFDSAELFEINENLGFEEDVQASPSKRGRPRKIMPSTPGKQLITEDKICTWHGKSFHGGFSSDEEDSDSEPRVKTKLANPFLSTEQCKQSKNSPFRTSRGNNPFTVKQNQVDYATHLELVNHRTGERKVTLLSEEQQKFKPKKIDFSGI
ncbi:hypothetical protein JCM33374_g3416 [Metschnikowia sp. JCM 33374]|nr:hypothetical protein JCM33374_g3416 [Metschnikowia sp. JCM 33374]